MPVRRYGIYLAYAPGTDLRAEGLGRHLSSFLAAAQEQTDAKFVIACPSWMRTTLMDLFKENEIRSDAFEILAPKEQPLVLTVMEKYRQYRTRPRPHRPKLFFQKLRSRFLYSLSGLERRIVATRSKLFIAGLTALALPFALLGTAVSLAAVIFMKLLSVIHKLFRLAFAWTGIDRGLSWLRNSILLNRASVGLAFYNLMEEAEVALIRKMVKDRKDIGAWYCPTVFWPQFNEISDARVICVPDVVTKGFSVGFAMVTNEHFVENFKRIERTISGSRHFITYSNHVKNHTLMTEYGVEPNNVDVVLHGSNALGRHIFVSGFPDNEAATDAYCRRLFGMALKKAVDNPIAEAFAGNDVRFLIYPTQFRPNKNIVELLRAYEWLLRRRFIGLKLILTGNPKVLPEIGHFIVTHQLETDVLFLHKLSLKELAACYRLADLAINPSLSEGGFPFTFSEALSVGTPIVMARIPATEEILVEPELAEATLFDGYQWRNIADKIEWALANREKLHALQKKFYDDVISKRTWSMVISEHIAILDRIASSSASAE